MLRSLVGMTGPVIRGRAGRTPLPFPPPETLSPHAPMSPCPHAPSRVSREFTFALLHGFFASLVNVSTCQHVPSRQRLPPCHRASMSPRASACPHAPVPTCPLAALTPRTPLAAVTPRPPSRRLRRALSPKLRMSDDSFFNFRPLRVAQSIGEFLRRTAPAI